MPQVPVREKRSRKVLIWAVVCFVLIQQAGVLLLDYRWPQLRFPMAAQRVAWMTTCPPADVILFGSSRFCSIHAPTVEAGLQEAGAGTPVHVFNASVEAGDLVATEYVLMGLMHAGAQPRQIVIEVSPETVTRCNRWILYHIGRQMTWKDVPRYLPDIVREGHVMRLLKARLLPFYTYRQNIWKATAPALEHLLAPAEIREPAPVLAQAPAPRARFIASMPGPRPKSVETLLTSRPVEFAKGHDKPAPAADPTASPQTVGDEKGITHWLEDYETGGGISQRALERIVRRCNKRGIHVLLVGVPVSSAHRSFYTPAVEKAFASHMDYFVRTYGCDYVDCRDTVPDSGFADHHHLNQDGTRFFSEYLGKEVLAPYWADADRIAATTRRAPEGR
jgi:hypothetical protein